MSDEQFRGRVYELQHGQWVELGPAAARASGWRTFAGLAAGAFAIAVMAALTIVAAVLTVVLLPVGLVLAWLGARRRGR
jgi:hypothetical protein